MTSIAVIGSANADLVVHVDRRPEGGETLLGSDLVITPGGKGANQAVAAGLLGAEVRFVGCVGADANGELLRQSLLRAGVGTEALEACDSATGCALIFITPDGENSIVVAPGANNAVSEQYLRQHQDDWIHADIVVMQLEIPMAGVEYVAATCAAKGVRFLLNAAPAARVSERVLQVCDPLVVNESEAVLLLGGDRPAGQGPVDLARRLLATGPHSVVLTLGAAGSIAIEAGGEPHFQAASQVTAVDTTGAGDAFVGALAKALAAGEPMATGLALGSAVAALAVQRPGAQASFPTINDLEPA
ncbi:MAG: ribokinase [Propionibacteriaceae bacterium]|nr:ribokinase [Propionibacteriaceae bacterium]